MQNFNYFSRTAQSNLKWLNQGDYSNMNRNLKNTYKTILEQRLYLNEYREPQPSAWPWLRNFYWLITGRAQPPGRAGYADAIGQWVGKLWTRHHWRLSDANISRIDKTIRYVFWNAFGVKIKDVKVFGNPPRFLVQTEDDLIHTLTPDGLVEIEMPSGWTWEDDLPPSFWHPDNIDNIIKPGTAPRPIPEWLGLPSFGTINPSLPGLGGIINPVDLGWESQSDEYGDFPNNVPPDDLDPNLPWWTIPGATPFSTSPRPNQP